MKLFYLGPEGTFTHQAAMTAADQFATLGDFDLIALPDVPAIMQAVQSRQGWGVIAWENNVEGYVVPNLDALIDAPNAAGFARISVDVAFNAFTVRGHSIYDCTGNPVSAHPHGLAQCTRFIAEHHLQPEPASSNAAACRDLKPGRVALGPSICGELYDLDTLAEHVQDFDGAHTEPVGRKGGYFMRSKALPPARAQGHIVPFLEAAALFAALCIFARTAALMLAAAITAPLPMAETLFWLGRQSAQEQPASSVQVEAAPDSTPEAAASSLPQAVQALTGNIEDYLVPLLGEEARPADAGTVIEKNYPQGSGEKYIPCGAGSIKNNTRQTAADIAAEIENPLPFAIEPNSPDPQVLVMHTHATEDYRLSAGLWFAPGDGARSTDCSVNMCAVGRVVADTLNAAGINTLHDETLNDYPSYTGSYANSRAVVQQYLARYPSIKVVLDVHRDAIETESGSRYAPVCTVDGRQAAQVMIICGCDNGTTVQLPGWRQNLRFAAAWERSMEGMYPGFTRPVLFSYRFYNQDLTTGSLLIEIGGHGNNLNEALYAGQLAAKGLAAALLGGA